MALGFKSDGLTRTHHRVGGGIALRDLPNMMLEDVRYADSPSRSFIERLSSWLPPQARIDTKFLRIKRDLIQAACTLNSNSYASEKEIRLIKSFRDFYQNDHQLYTNGFIPDHYEWQERNKERCLVYKREFKISQVNEVVLGCNCPLNEEEVREMLQRLSFSDEVEVRRSGHSYRVS